MTHPNTSFPAANSLKTTESNIDSNGSNVPTLLIPRSNIIQTSGHHSERSDALTSSILSITSKPAIQATNPDSLCDQTKALVLNNVISDGFSSISSQVDAAHLNPKTSSGSKSTSQEKSCSHRALPESKALTTVPSLPSKNVVGSAETAHLNTDRLFDGRNRSSYSVERDYKALLLATPNHTNTVRAMDSHSAKSRQQTHSYSLRPKRSTQSIPRRAVKSYLFAELPPVMTFHLKRFQVSEKGKNGSVFFSGTRSFKKIDDVVSFPQCLDKTEWVAPPREEYDRHGRLKPSSDPRVLDQRQREQDDINYSNRIEATAHSPSMVRADHDVSTKESHRLSGLAGRVRTPSTSILLESSADIERDDPAGQSHKRFQPTDRASRSAQILKDVSRYRLYAVIAHHGSTIQDGHYTAYVLSDRCTSGTEVRGSRGGAKHNASHTPDASSSAPRPRILLSSSSADDQQRFKRPDNRGSEKLPPSATSGSMGQSVRGGRSRR